MTDENKSSEDNGYLVKHSGYVLPALFSLFVFMSAGLLFAIQPLLTRMITPLMGGVPGVWTTAVLFFQVMMILGYFYAHLLTRLPGLQYQIGVHLILWLLALLILPIEVSREWVSDKGLSIHFRTLSLYATTIGLPFLFLAANAPLLQNWYAQTRGPSSSDPYFLYGASNIGALIALLGFPLLAEPLLGISVISSAWSVGFIGFGIILLCSVVFILRLQSNTEASIIDTEQRTDINTLFRWGAIAFVPSSLMLALTTKITTDFGSFPLLWVIPLAVYLLTWICGFRAHKLIDNNIMSIVYVIALIMLAVFGMSGLIPLLTISGCVIMIIAFALIGFCLHGILYQLRPEPARLTIFYLMVAIGGAAGGFFNAILAPILMNGFHEFPLTLLASAGILLLIPENNGLKSESSELNKNSRFGLIPVLILLAGISFEPNVFLVSAFPYIAASIILIGCILLVFRRFVRIGVAIMTFMVMSNILISTDIFAVHVERNFFGVHKIVDKNGIRQYINGNTIHGAVALPLEGPPKPLYYYHENGALADVANSTAWREAEHIGLVGLGVGSMLAYKQPEQKVSIYEIDIAVVNIALNPGFFGFTTEYGDKNVSVNIGDARIVLDEQEAEKTNAFGGLLIDAYSSDAIPMHLATIEAVELFMNAMAPGGVLVFHISNRYYDLSRPVGAAAAQLGLKVYQRIDEPFKPGHPGLDTGINALVLVRPEEKHDFLVRENSTWKEIFVDPSFVWTDERASPITALK